VNAIKPSQYNIDQQMQQNQMRMQQNETALNDAWRAAGSPPRTGTAQQLGGKTGMPTSSMGGFAAQSRMARPGETDNTTPKNPATPTGLGTWNPQVGGTNNAHGMYTMNTQQQQGNTQPNNMGVPQSMQQGSWNPQASPQYGGGQPPSFYNAPYNAQNSPISQFLTSWQTNAGDYGKWGSDDYREQATGYAGSYAAPWIAAQQADRTQLFNEQSWGANFNEQQRLNQSQMGLDWAGNNREDTALNYGMISGDRDYREGQRQFDQNYGLQNRQAAQAYDLGSQEMRNQAARNANELHLGNRGIDAQLTQYGNEFALGNREADNTATRNRNELHLGEGALRNQEFANNSQRMNYEMQNRVAEEQNRIDSEYRRGLISNEEYNNQTGRLAQASQDAQWRDTNAYQREQLAQQMGWNREELGVQAALQREGYANQLQQSRYGAFGRSQAPNTTAWARGWN
jgi:hypothetical protein